MTIVSILIPCYNVEAYLPQCLDSIINQTYKDLQIVLVDDGSTDSTLAIAQEYAQKDSRIEVYHQENQGVAAARNVLLSHIKGDYFLFIDSDDWAEPLMVEFLLSRAMAYKAEIVTCDCAINDAAVSDRNDEIIYSQEQAIERFLYHKEFRGMLWNKLIASSILGNSQFRKDISYGEDALFCWGLLKSSNKIIYTDKQLYHYRMNDNSISHHSFGPQKMTAYQVWTKITEDSSTRFPQFAEIGKGHFAVSMTILLRDAVKSHYPYDSNIQDMQVIARNYGHLITKYHLSSWKMRTYAFVAGRCYRILKYLP